MKIAREQALADALREAGRATARALSGETGLPVLRVERCLLWLEKYGFSEREA